jgi:flagellar biosynthesis protein FliQ
MGIAKLMEKVLYFSLMALLSSILIGLTAGVWMSIFAAFSR